MDMRRGGRGWGEGGGREFFLLYFIIIIIIILFYLFFGGEGVFSMVWWGWKGCCGYFGGLRLFFWVVVL